MAALELLAGAARGQRVATDTREGEVFTRLLEKVEEQRKAYGGKVFDVLGAAFDETPLRDLLVEAGLVMAAPRGIAMSPLKGLHLSDNLQLNYIVTAVAT